MRRARRETEEGRGAIGSGGRSQGSGVRRAAGFTGFSAASMGVDQYSLRLPNDHG